MFKQYESERGQALVLIVLGILGLFGFAALAIDGGRIYMDRRTMQNASDTASLTGAATFAEHLTQNQVFNNNFSCAGAWYGSAESQAYSDGIARASANGYAIDADVSDVNGITASCGSVTYVGFTDNYVDVTTYITADTPPSFVQLVFSGPLRQTVESTARIRPQTSAVFGHAIVALNPADCQGNQNGAQFDGNDTVYVDGGGVFSNGCLGIGGTSLEIDVDNGGNTYVGSGQLAVSGGPTADPWPAQGNAALPDDTFRIPAPNCAGLPNQSVSGTTLNPGRYTGNTNINSGGPYVMNPGLYCFNGRFRITGGTVIGNGVTIFMISGDFEVGGNAEVHFTAPLSSPDPSPALPNVVIYMHEDNPGVVSMLGNDESSYQGTVFAPTGEIEVGGTASVNPTYSTQLIGWNVFVHGNSDIFINFDDFYAYQLPPRLDFQR